MRTPLKSLDPGSSEAGSHIHSWHQWRNLWSAGNVTFLYIPVSMLRIRGCCSLLPGERGVSLFVLAMLGHFALFHSCWPAKASKSMSWGMGLVFRVSIRPYGRPKIRG